MFKKYFWCFSLFLFFACENDDNGNGTIQTINERDFVWKAMNTWYFWQTDVANLDDGIATQGEAQYLDFLNSFNSTEDLFDNLLFNFGSTDRFSAIFANRNELDNALSGVSVSFGYEVGLAVVGDSDNIVMWIEYVVPDGPADNAGIKRGDLFTQVNGTTLNINNYIDLLFGNTTINLGFAERGDTGFVPTGQTVDITAVTLSENPVLIADVIEYNGVKTAYLVYNRFTSNYDNDLNNAFGQFITEGAEELVIDLRYNGGGSVQTAQYLASMITGQFTGQRFADLRFNEKLGDQFNNSYDFVTAFNGNGGAINSMNLERLFVLTTQETASASEMIINSLRPYIEVVQIGTTTTGKNVGQVPLYDSENSLFTNSNTATTEHNYALLPICFTYFNSQNESNFSAGIAPNITINEVDFIDNLLPLGTLTEPFLAEALEQITGENPSGDAAPGAFGLLNESSNITLYQLEDLDSHKLLGQGMYIESVENQ